MVGYSRGGRTRAKPGAVLKACRTERGWTLSDVSQRTGLSVSTLSKVENDKMALTYDKLVRLSEGLEIDLARLFGPTGASPVSMDGATRRSVTRAGAGTSVEMPRGNYLYVATDLLNKHMVPIIGEVLATDIDQYGEFMRHPGEEYVYVLEGTLDLHTRMYTPVRLEKGDSVYFDSGMEHAYIAVGGEPCRILSVCSGPERQLLEALESEIASGSNSQARVVTPATPPRITRGASTRASPDQPAKPANPAKSANPQDKRRTRRSA
jgi:mannose-6-phosphate isomerase-like protein (cupin superfamily)/DNA-binding Xre family transcriptional regulator